MWVFNNRFIIATCVLFQNVCGDIVRYEDGTFVATFSVEHPARMGGQTVLAYFHNIGLYDCTIKCVQWIQCMTVNYSFKQSICELVDSEFDEFETDGPFPDPEWINLGTPERIDGGYSSWKKATSCSVSCGNGTQRQFRECDNPRPQHGGEDCKGARVKNVHCHLTECPVHGNWGSWSNFTNVCEGEIEKRRTRHCDSPAPNSLGLPCLKVDDTRGLEENEAVIYPDNSQCVCYGDKSNTFGTIKVRLIGKLKSIRLIHVSGWVSCFRNKVSSVWGCFNYHLPIIATVERKRMIFPDKFLGSYKKKVSLGDYNKMGNEIVYHATEPEILNGETLGIWFYEDFANAGAGDNSGNKHCVRVDIEYY